MNLEDTLPTAGQSFAQIIEQNKLYVDKTDLVAHLARKEGPFFLARPRRFGKTLLLSTFKELFLHGKKSFAGLKLEKDAPWVDKDSYKVLHLNLARISSARSKFTFEERLSGLLADEFAKYDVAWGNNKDWMSNLSAALEQCSPRSLVLLIDEYDAPLSRSLKDPDEFEDRRDIITDLLIATKEFSDKFRFAFFTGISEFSCINLGSEPNNVRDISFHSEYGAITGITQEELETYCKPYIINSAQVLNAKYPGQGWDEGKVLEELKLHYDGYSFDREAKVRVYNPWSVLNFFELPGAGFNPYWLRNRAAKSTVLFHSLDKLIKSGNGLSELTAYLSSDFVKISDESNLAVSLDIENIETYGSAFDALLYQTGYLTIKKANQGEFKLGFPNNEVKTAFADLVIKKLTNEKSNYASLRNAHAQKLTDAFASQDYDAIKSEFEKLLSRITYLSLPSFGETACRDVLCSLLEILGFQSKFEEPSNTGDADLIVETEKYLYVFEFKVATDEKEIPALLEKARDQIKTRRYGVRLTHKTVITCAAVILNTYRARNRPKDLPHVFKVAKLCKAEELP